MARSIAEYQEGERVVVWMNEHPVYPPGFYEAEVGEVAEEGRLSILVFTFEEGEEYYVGTLSLSPQAVRTRVVSSEEAEHLLGVIVD